MDQNYTLRQMHIFIQYQGKAYIYNKICLCDPVNMNHAKKAETPLVG